MINGNENQKEVIIQTNTINQTFIKRPSAINNMLIKAQEIIRKVPQNKIGNLNKSFEINSYKNSIQKVYETNEINQSNFIDVSKQSKDYSKTFDKGHQKKEAFLTREFLENNERMSIENSELNKIEKSLDLNNSITIPKMEYEITFKPLRNLKEKECKEYHIIKNDDSLIGLDQKSQFSKNNFGSIHQSEERKQLFKENKNEILEQKSVINNKFQTYNFLKGYNHIEKSKVSRAKSCSENQVSTSFQNGSRKEANTIDHEGCCCCCCHQQNLNCLTYNRASIQIKRNPCTCFRPKSKVQKMKEYSENIVKFKLKPFKKVKKEEVINQDICKRRKSRDVGLEIFNYIQKPEKNCRDFSKDKKSNTSTSLNYKKITYQRIKEYRKKNYQRPKKKEKIKMIKVIQELEIPTLNKKVGPEIAKPATVVDQKKKILLLKSKGQNTNKLDLYEASQFLQNSKTKSTDQYSYELYGNLSKLNQTNESNQQYLSKMKEEKNECQVKTYLENLNIEKYKEQISEISEKGESALFFNKATAKNGQINMQANKFDSHDNNRIMQNKIISNNFGGNQLSNKAETSPSIISQMNDYHTIQKVKEKDQAILNLEKEIQYNENIFNQNESNKKIIIKEDYNRNNLIIQKERESEVRNVTSCNQNNHNSTYNENFKGQIYDSAQKYNQEMMLPNQYINNQYPPPFTQENSNFHENFNVANKDEVNFKIDVNQNEKDIQYKDEFDLKIINNDSQFNSKNDPINFNSPELNKNMQNINIVNKEENRTNADRVNRNWESMNQKVEEIPQIMTNTIIPTSQSPDRNSKNFRDLKGNEDPTYSDDFETQKSQENYILNDNPSAKESISIQEEILPSSNSNSKSLHQTRNEIESKKESVRQLQNNIDQEKIYSPSRVSMNQKDSNIRTKDQKNDLDSFSKGENNVS